MTFGPKRAGCCLGCGEAVYEVKQTWEEGPLAGSPRRLGPMLEHGCQVELLMSDGSEADITFCVTDATAITPDDLPAIWSACLDHLDLVLQLSGKSDNERRAHVAAAMRAYPVAILRKRREGVVPGMLVIDRR